ncbi:MAG TPA: YebC/PmpR family DNA-binding transcriptional regulator [Bacteroidales bacterium]|nr:YebC/PmpR family DNA-binding transcriptional regulator [Bacteroidales bacterium]
MSGHSKWSTIKRKKGANDAKRGKMFTRLIKEITIAARDGGGDRETNHRLRLAVQNAKGANMPKDNIERAIKKAIGDDATKYEKITFEGYAPNGIAVFVECLSDNNNRTVASVRSIFNKYGGNLGTNGSLSFLFERKGIFTVMKSDNLDMDGFELELIDGGAEDIETDEDMITITCAMEDFGNLNKKLEEMGIEPVSADLQRVPNDTKQLDLTASGKVLKLIDSLEEDDDVQNVFHNLEMTEELEAELEKQ